MKITAYIWIVAVIAVFFLGWMTRQATHHCPEIETTVRGLKPDTIYVDSGRVSLATVVTPRVKKKRSILENRDSVLVTDSVDTARAADTVTVASIDTTTAHGTRIQAECKARLILPPVSFDLIISEPPDTTLTQIKEVPVPDKAAFTWGFATGAGVVLATTVLTLLISK